jgi:hypothetical protein
MSNGEKKTKDFWDKMDILGKLLTGIVLGVLTIVIKLGADKIQQGSEQIAAAQKNGQLVQSLVSDLSKPEGGIKQDIAIIALDRSVGAKDPDLVLDIAEQIVRNRPKEQNGQIARVVAFQIIARRNPERADQIKNELLGSIAETTEQRDKLISNADTSAQPEKPPDPDSSLISAAFPRIVYLQFQGDLKRTLVEEFRKSLNDQGLPSPGVQRVPGSYANNVRFFNDEDREQAKVLAATAKQFFDAKGCPIEFQLNDLSNSKFKTQKGHFEIWINTNCK